MRHISQPFYARLRGAIQNKIDAAEEYVLEGRCGDMIAYKAKLAERRALTDVLELIDKTLSENLAHD